RLVCFVYKSIRQFKCFPLRAFLGAVIKNRKMRSLYLYKFSAIQILFFNYLSEQSCQIDQKP
ncbi:MAG: hypothetical protein PUD03_07760, partial [Lachnospiraceae bacterium]|nr:hypothetical protein [Lachnospiraceae bacterium]